MTVSEQADRPKVVVVGGGYGGTAVAKALDETSDVVLVEPKDAFMHNIAALRALVDPSWLPRMFLPYEGCWPTVVSCVIVPSWSSRTGWSRHRARRSPRTTSCWPPGRGIPSRPRPIWSTPITPTSRSVDP